MSHQRRLRRRLQRAATVAHDTWVVTHWAATRDQDLADLESAKRQTHDFLVTELGPRRRSGISWRIWTGAERFDAMDRAGVPADHDDLRAFVAAHPDGFLVMASCEALR